MNFQQIFKVVYSFNIVIINIYIYIETKGGIDSILPIPHGHAVIIKKFSSIFTGFQIFVVWILESYSQISKIFEHKFTINTLRAVPEQILIPTCSLVFDLYIEK